MRLFVWKSRFMLLWTGRIRSSRMMRNSPLESCGRYWQKFCLTCTLYAKIIIFLFFADFGRFSHTAYGRIVFAACNQQKKQSRFFLSVCSFLRCWLDGWFIWWYFSRHIIFVHLDARKLIGTNRIAHGFIYITLDFFDGGIFLYALSDIVFRQTQFFWQYRKSRRRAFRLS